MDFFFLFFLCFIVPGLVHSFSPALAIQPNSVWYSDIQCWRTCMDIKLTPVSPPSINNFAKDYTRLWAQAKHVIFNAHPPSPPPLFPPYIPPPQLYAWPLRYFVIYKIASTNVLSETYLFILQFHLFSLKLYLFSFFHCFILLLFVWFFFLFLLFESILKGQ